jgi:hypothetical protein
MLLLAFIAALSAASPVPLPDVERAVLALTNAERTRHGLSPLQHEETLGAIARSHSADMLRRNFFDHTNPDGDGPGDRIAKHHRRLIGEGGENVWAGSGYGPERLAEQIVSDWMHSPGHRANILGREFTHLGVGVVYERDEVRATQNFETVAGWTETPVPRSVRRGTALDLRAVAVSGPAIAEFDLWSEERGVKVFGPAPLVGAAIEAPHGTYVIRFYTPTSARRYTIHRGPEIEVK